LYLVYKGSTGVHATRAILRCQSSEALPLSGIGSDPSLQAQDEREISAERMTRLILFFRRETRKESLKCGLWLHPSSIQVRFSTQKSRLFAGLGSMVRI
jgi:hypothetical protein